MHVYDIEAYVCGRGPMGSETEGAMWEYDYYFISLVKQGIHNELYVVCGVFFLFMMYNVGFEIENNFFWIWIMEMVKKGIIT